MRTEIVRPWLRPILVLSIVVAFLVQVSMLLTLAFGAGFAAATVVVIFCLSSLERISDPRSKFTTSDYVHVAILYLGWMAMSFEVVTESVPVAITVVAIVVVSLRLVRGCMRKSDRIDLLNLRRASMKFLSPISILYLVNPILDFTPAPFSYLGYLPNVSECSSTASCNSYYLVLLVLAMFLLLVGIEITRPLHRRYLVIPNETTSFYDLVARWNLDPEDCIMVKDSQEETGIIVVRPCDEPPK